MTSGILGLGFPRLSSFSTGKDNRKAFISFLIVFWKFTKSDRITILRKFGGAGLIRVSIVRI